MKVPYVRRRKRYSERLPGVLPYSIPQNNDLVHKRYLVYVILAVVLYLSFIILAVLPLTFPGMTDAHRLWRGYYTLLVQEMTAPQEIVSLLESDPIVRWVICREDTQLIYNDIVGLDTVGLPELEDRFDTLDPRYDQYMKKVPQFFKTYHNGQSWSIYYLRSDASPITTYFYTNRKLNGVGMRWRLAEVNMSGKVIALGHLALFLLLLCLRHLSFNKVVLLVGITGALPWCINILCGNTPEALAAFVICYMWFLFISDFIPYMKSLHLHEWKDVELRQRVFRKLYVFGGLTVGVGIMMLPGNSGAFTVRIFATLAAYCAFCGFVTFIMLIAGSRQRHLPFEPVGILRSPKLRAGNDKRNDLFAPLFVCVLASFFFLSYFCYPLRGFEIPKPSNLHGVTDFSWSSLERLWLSNSPGMLPNVSDYVTHLSFQEGFTFGRQYIFPTEQREVKLSMYSYLPEENRIIKSERIVKIFDETWLNSRLGIIQGGMLEQLFVEQKRPVMVTFSSLHALSFDGTSIWRLGALCVLFLGLLITNFRLTPLRLYGMRSRLYESA